MPTNKNAGRPSVTPVKEAIAKAAVVKPAPKLSTNPSTGRPADTSPVDEGWVLPIE